MHIYTNTIASLTTRNTKLHLTAGYGKAWVLQCITSYAPKYEPGQKLYCENLLVQLMPATDQNRDLRLRAVYFESGGTTFPFLLICSFFFITHSLPLPLLFSFCFFLGRCLSDTLTCTWNERKTRRQSAPSIFDWEHLTQEREREFLSKPTYRMRLKTNKEKQNKRKKKSEFDMQIHV